MFGYLYKKLFFLAHSIKQSHQDSNTEDDALCSDLKINLENIKEIMGTSDDIVVRKFSFGNKKNVNAVLIFVNGLIDKKTINQSIIKPLMDNDQFVFSEQNLPDKSLEYIKKTLLSVAQVKLSSSRKEIIENCLSGYTVLMFDKAKDALLIDTEGWEKRSLEEPKTEIVLRGPREGFTESIGTNAALLRRKIKSPGLTFEVFKLGRQTRTTIYLAYLRNKVNPKLIEEIKQRITKISIDAILESGYIEQFIEDDPSSIFPTIANSERPDVVAAKILEGRAAIIIDGTPFVLTVPMLFIESLQSSEDYYLRPYFASSLRLLRILSLFIGVLAPAFYVALTTFNHELIPTPLLITMIAAKEGTPFPSFLEAIGMTIVFEILREAGIRLPRAVGQSISIVGALVLGEAAVSAGLIGAPMVIVIAITAISSFAIPTQYEVISILRIIFIFLAAIIGWLGIALGLLEVLVHLCSLRSFGTPYLSPFAPLSTGDLKDTLIRSPLSKMRNRPRTIGWREPQRQNPKR